MVFGLIQWLMILGLAVAAWKILRHDPAAGPARHRVPAAPPAQPRLLVGCEDATIETAPPTGSASS